MQATRPEFSLPVLCIDEFLDPAEAENVMQECLDLQRAYAPGRVFDGLTSTAIRPEHRNNEVLYIERVMGAAPERSAVLAAMKRAIWTDEYRALWHQGYLIFDVINYSTHHECVISRCGDGQYFRKHQDIRRDHITYRLVTIVYFIHRAPRSFSGGNLVIWNGDDSLRFTPEHNRAIVFPSFAMHEVEPTHMQSPEWNEGRFSINYWIGFE
jgi:SM-20-related protein